MSCYCTVWRRMAWYGVVWYVCLCVRMYVCMYVCMCIIVYLYIRMYWYGV